MTEWWYEKEFNIDDSFARIESAQRAYQEFTVELDRYLYNHIGDMFVPEPSSNRNAVVRLPHPKDSVVKGRPRVLATNVVENLKSALDYAVFVASKRASPEMNPRQSTFVIVDNKATFDVQSKTALKHLPLSARQFMESLQPYHGNDLLKLIRDAANVAKHRKMLSLLDSTSFEVDFVDEATAYDDKYKQWWFYPLPWCEGAVAFARPTSRTTVRFLDHYEAVGTLEKMITHVTDIVRAFAFHLQGQPFPTVVPS